MNTLLDCEGRQLQSRHHEWLSPEPLPISLPLLLPLERYLAEGAPSAHAVLLPNTVDVTRLPASVLAAPLVVLDYPSFADGRAHSQAYLLSRSGHYSGRLRARGAAVIYDQLLMMKRCGFTEFELRADQDPAACAALLSRKLPSPGLAQ